MTVLYRIFRVADSLLKFGEVEAHCDIPCGIYDPHAAQIAAHTVIRMVKLISELPQLTPQMTPEQRQEVIHKLSRYITIKEEHAETVKREIRILWGDYFKPEHIQQFPDLHESVWKVMKAGSKARQEISLRHAEELLASVQKIAEIFWKTKGIESAKVKAPYPSGGDIIVPKLS